MTTYLVTWAIDIDADTPGEAAEKARAIQRDPDSTATIFTVVCGSSTQTVVVDLLEGE